MLYELDRAVVREKLVLLELMHMKEYADSWQGEKEYQKHAKALTRIIKAIENGDFE